MRNLASALEEAKKVMAKKAPAKKGKKPMKASKKIKGKKKTEAETDYKEFVTELEKWLEDEVEQKDAPIALSDLFSQIEMWYDEQPNVTKTAIVTTAMTNIENNFKRILKDMKSWI